MIERAKILWFGCPPSDDDVREASNRHLVIECVKGKAAPDFERARGAVFWATTGHFSAAANQFKETARQALNHGLYLHVVVDDDGQHDHFRSQITLIMGKSPIAANVRIRIVSSGAFEAPEKIARHAPGPAVNRNLKIELPEGVSISEAQTFVLQRAFSDCKVISLQVLTGGLSGARTFYLEATLQASNAGPRPSPFFAKLDASDRLKAEHDLYQEYAEHHIPWNLRPNFDSQRCVYGVDAGILVGKFAQKTVSLWDVMRSGAGAANIRSLFNETLIGWRSQAEKDELVRDKSVATALRGFFDHTRVSASRVAMARQFGEVEDPESLWLQLLDLPSHPWRLSPMHGDMHGENVRVRNTDAIVIDFAKARRGPICADLASLEVWTALHLPPANELPSQQEWVGTVGQLYEPQVVEAFSVPRPGHECVTWLASSVGEIRSIAKSVCQCPDEYQQALAVYLLRHSTFEAESEVPDEDDQRRSFAYYLASRIITAMSEKHGLREAA